MIFIVKLGLLKAIKYIAKVTLSIIKYLVLG